MTDDGFDFRPPTERREPKRFEPPPWEQGAFEELERRKAEQARAEEAARAAAELAAAEPAAEARGESGGAEEPSQAPGPAVGPAHDERPEALPTAVPEQVPSEKRRGVLEESRVVELMARLAAEEPPAVRNFWKVALVAALVLVGIGTVLMVWGIAALAGASRTGTVGSFGGTVILLFGAGFIAAAVWLVVRTLRQRGVL